MVSEKEGVVDRISAMLTKEPDTSVCIMDLGREEGTLILCINIRGRNSLFDKIDEFLRRNGQCLQDAPIMVRWMTLDEFSNLLERGGNIIVYKWMRQVYHNGKSVEVLRVDDTHVRIYPAGIRSAVIVRTNSTASQPRMSELA